MYIKENLGAEKTRIYYLDFNGKINKYAAKRGIVNCVYEVLPQLKDHKIDDDIKNNNIIF